MVKKANVNKTEKISEKKQKFPKFEIIEQDEKNSAHGKIKELQRKYQENLNLLNLNYSVNQIANQIRYYLQCIHDKNKEIEEKKQKLEELGKNRKKFESEMRILKEKRPDESKFKEIEDRIKKEKDNIKKLKKMGEDKDFKETQRLINQIKEKKVNIKELEKEYYKEKDKINRLDVVNKEIEKIKENEETLQKEIKQLKERIKTDKKNLNEYMKEISNNEETKKILNWIKTNLSREKEKITKEITKLSDKVELLQKKKEKFEKRRNELSQKRIVFFRKIKIKNVEININNIEKEIEKLRKKIEEKSMEIKKLDVKISKEGLIDENAFEIILNELDNNITENIINNIRYKRKELRQFLIDILKEHQIESSEIDYFLNLGWKVLTITFRPEKIKFNGCSDHPRELFVSVDSFDDRTIGKDIENEMGPILEKLEIDKGKITCYDETHNYSNKDVSKIRGLIFDHWSFYGSEKRPVFNSEYQALFAFKEKELSLINFVMDFLDFSLLPFQDKKKTINEYRDYARKAKPVVGVPKIENAQYLVINETDVEDWYDDPWGRPAVRTIRGLFIIEENRNIISSPIESYLFRKRGIHPNQILMIDGDRAIFAENFLVKEKEAFTKVKLMQASLNENSNVKLKEIKEIEPREYYNYENENKGMRFGIVTRISKGEQGRIKLHWLYPKYDGRFPTYLEKIEEEIYLPTN